MKRILMVGLIVGLAGSAIAQTTTVTGTIKDLTQAVVTSGKVTFTLAPSRDTTISGLARFSPQTITCLINASGLIKAQDGVSACVITTNTSLQPTGSYYVVGVWPYNVKTSTFTFYAVNASYDWSTVVPTPTTSPAQNFVDIFSTQTIGGNKTFSGTVAFNGPLSFAGGITGNNTFSGSNTFVGNSIFSTLSTSGLATLASLTVGGGSTFGAVNEGAVTAGATSASSVSTPSDNGTLFVGTGITTWSGSDLGAQLNSAYAALPSNGGTIHIINGAYSVSTAVVFATASKPVQVDCDPETKLTWTPTSGTMFTFNYGNASTLHPRNAGIDGCTIVGPVSGTAKALFLGGTNGSEGFVLRDSKITWTVGTAVTFDNNTFATLLEHDAIIAQVGANFPVGVVSGGEDIEFRNTMFQGVTGGYVGCVTMSNAGLNLNVFGSSFDDCQFVGGLGFMNMNGTHFENPGQRADSTSNPALTSPSNAIISAVTFFQDAGVATKAQEVLVTGGANVTFYGVGVSSNATIADFVTNSGTGTVRLSHGPQNFGGYTAVGNATSSGNVIDEMSNGAAGPLVTIFTSSGSRGTMSFNGPVKVSNTTFATLPTCAAGFEGTSAGVTDSTTNAWGATITGGGANHVGAYCDGSNWTVAGK